MKKIYYSALALLVAGMSIVNLQAQGPTSGQIEGTWKLRPIAYSLAVGDAPGNYNWWGISGADVIVRSCLYDDQYVFTPGGTFANILGTQTWLESWQGTPEGCGTPVAPHNGSNAATWAIDSVAGNVTINGLGAYLGLAKVHNTGEDGMPINSEITYNYSLEADSLDITIQGFNPGVPTAEWLFKFIRINCNIGVSPSQNDATIFGGSDGDATATVTGDQGNVTYLWNNGNTTASITGLVAGTYSVTVMDDVAAGCAASETITITEPLAGCSITAAVSGTSVTNNGGSDGSASVSTTGGQGVITYMWSNGASTASITGLVAGTYSVTVMDDVIAGCRTSSSVTIIEPAGVSCTLSGYISPSNNVTTAGGSDGMAVAVATGDQGNVTYLWSNSATTAAINNLTAGVYTVTITDDTTANCDFIVSTTITEPTVNPTSGQIEGTWKLRPIAYSLAVGEAPGNYNWWGISDSDVIVRSCLYDDEYVFNTDGSFENIVGIDTWLESWQGQDPEGCGAPVAPHDGSNAATWTIDSVAGNVTINGLGAYLGLAKVHNTGEDGMPMNNEITYNYSLEADSLDITIQGFNPGVPDAEWLFRLIRNVDTGSNGITDMIETNSFKLYPNPSKDNITIKSTKTIDYIVIRDILGRNVFEQDNSINNILSVSLENFTSDVYFVEVHSNGVSETKKLVVIN
jgi:uncharacterized protein (DUF2141 family)